MRHNFCILGLLLRLTILVPALPLEIPDSSSLQLPNLLAGRADSDVDPEMAAMQSSGERSPLSLGSSTEEARNDPLHREYQ